jgi:hypothetical protein
MSPAVELLDCGRWSGCIPRGHFDIELLRAGLPGRRPIVVALLLAVCALWLYHQTRSRPESAPIRWLAANAASLVIELGVITLTGYFIGHNL